MDGVYFLALILILLLVLNTIFIYIPIWSTVSEFRSSSSEAGRILRNVDAFLSAPSIEEYTDCINGSSTFEQRKTCEVALVRNLLDDVSPGLADYIDCVVKTGNPFGCATGTSSATTITSNPPTISTTTCVPCTNKYV